jgi:hypothetical protein
VIEAAPEPDVESGDTVVVLPTCDPPAALLIGE